MIRIAIGEESKCEVRQGGLSSPGLFNLIDQLISQLSNAKIGYSIDRETVNLISYSDDMVQLSPSISAPKKLSL